MSAHTKKQLVQITDENRSFYIKSTCISYILSFNNSTIVYYTGQCSRSTKSLSYYLDFLDTKNFINVQQTYYINKEHIEFINYQSNYVKLKSGLIIHLSNHELNAMKDKFQPTL